MTDWISETFCSTVGWEHLQTLVDLDHRMAGSDGERAGAEATRNVLSDVGARNARLETFELQGWTRGDSGVSHPDSGSSYDSIALPRSSTGQVDAEFVDLGYGLSADFASADVEGKIVMAASNVPSYHDRLIHRREKYYYAVEAGADGFVFRNHVDGQLPPTGSVGRPDHPIGEIPAVGVSMEVGAALGRRFDGEVLRLSVDADIHDTTSQNVHAELGPETDERVLVTAHLDGHDIGEGAMDDGAGTAMLVEIARALATRETPLDTRVEFVGFGSEEVGLCGSFYHAEGCDPRSVKAVVNLDGVVRGRTLQFFTHTFDELEAAVSRVADRYDHPVSIIPKEGFRGDQWPLVREGVPGYFVSGVRDSNGRGYGHTSADTFDKLDVRNLREQAIFLTELVADLARTETTIPHRERADVAASFEAEGRAEGMKIVGEWPYA
ncbi:putative aminopeptidase [Halovivax ruber XH-70]|uniref:Carboxypeptidase Q n=1 Tax=Halovivax ruber (strain DSM 18193 / JCM 13892 / XH-70) TaxID=797302 RepID=L0IDU3_HALRX|nr:M28 family metallopeptidase [Halovivax ruber]AGB16924.1 putative aminopeptidase [Halovivax ruber XH-70]